MARTDQPHAADFDGNGGADFLDFLSFALAFGTTRPRSDLDDNGTIDFPDFLTFVQAFGTSNSDG